jgi:transposase
MKKPQIQKVKDAFKNLPVLDPKAAGVDIGSTAHYVCLPGEDEKSTEVRKFGTTTAQLQLLIALLQSRGVTSVAMESTHVYWIPLYEMLEGAGIKPVLVNARQLHKVPGRKTDVADCQWIQKLHSCGLLRGSFRPEGEIAAMRALTRQCANLVEEQTRAIAWMQKALDQMNVQVHRAVTEITGVTGLSIVRAIVAGERDALKLAALRDHRCRKSVAQIAEHLEGTWKAEHLFNLQKALEQFDFFQAQIEAYEGQVSRMLQDQVPVERREAAAPVHPKKSGKGKKKAADQPMRTTLWRWSGVDLTTIDGIGVGLARVILTEVGPDLSAFPTEGDFISWLHLCPRTAISGGVPLAKKRNGYGANRIGGMLRMAAVSLAQSASALGAQFRRLARRKNGKVAVLASSRKLAQLIYRLLRYGQTYIDIGEKAEEARHAARRLQAMIHQAKELGFQLVPHAAAG